MSGAVAAPEIRRPTVVEVSLARLTANFRAIEAAVAQGQMSPALAADEIAAVMGL